jgi:hypothetical protein
MSREDVIIDGEVIRDYMSSLEFMTPSERKHFKRKLELEAFKPKTCYYVREETDTLQTQISYDVNGILNLLNSLEDEIVDVFLECISFVASKKQTFSYSKEENSTIINAMIFHTGLKHPHVQNDSLRKLFETLLSTDERVDKINKLIKLLSN